jgi:hypothetical protein
MLGTMACSICKGVDHNKSNCPQNPEVIARREADAIAKERALEAAKQRASEEVERAEDAAFKRQLDVSLAAAAAAGSASASARVPPAKLAHDLREVEEEKVTWLFGDFLEDAVGESHYQPGLDRVAGGKTPAGHNDEVCAWLVPEPENKYDHNAVRVDIRGEPVGYLPAELAVVWQPVVLALMARYGRPVACAAIITGGWRREKKRGGGISEGSYGVKLRLMIGPPAPATWATVGAPTRPQPTPAPAFTPAPPAFTPAAPVFTPAAPPAYYAPPQPSVPAPAYPPAPAPLYAAAPPFPSPPVPRAPSPTMRTIVVWTVGGFLALVAGVLILAIIGTLIGPKPAASAAPPPSVKALAPPKPAPVRR